ncbi:MAG: hypothetical protein PWP47_809 [Synergistaceae bacterium]|jgi:hypothetical protein|nr:hypothetical protein [Synergistaceae bacterium]
MMQLKNFLLLLLLLPFFLFPRPVHAGDLAIGLEDGWIWQVAVLPPSDGWESERGKSALGAVRYAEWKVKDSADGVAGRDIRFLKEEPLSRDDAEERVARWRENGIAAVLSLGGTEDISLLRPLLGKSGPVFLSAYGEGGDITEGGVPLPMMFALDLYRDFRIAAFAEYAKRTLGPGSGVAILGDRLDPSLERFARNLGDMLSSFGYSVSRFWLPGAGMDSFRMIEAEAISEGASVLVSWAGSMVVRDIWRAVRRKEGVFRIWYGGEPLRLLLSFNGIVVADQDVPLGRDRSFVTLGREIWRRTRTVVKDASAAGRAYAACEWIFEGFRRAGSKDPGPLANAMKAVSDTALGSSTFSVNPATHRPFARETAILEVENRTFRPVDFFQVKGPEYLP